MPRLSFLILISVLTFGFARAQPCINGLPAGKADPCFGPDSAFFMNGFSLQGQHAEIKDMVMLPTGKYLIGGVFDRYKDEPADNLVRLNPDGSLDRTFPYYRGVNDYVADLLVLPNQKVLVAGGFTQFGGQPRKQLVRLNSDGTLDLSFDFGSGVTFAADGSNGGVGQIALFPDGKIAFIGNFDRVQSIPQRQLCRLLTNGAMDTTYRPDPVSGQGIGAIGILMDGSVIMADAVQNVAGKLSPDGRTFQSNLVHAEGPIHFVEPLANGKFILAGVFRGIYLPNSQSMYQARGMARFAADGTFEQDLGLPEYGDGNPFVFVRGLKTMGDGRIVVVEDRWNYGGIKGTAVQGNEYTLRRFTYNGAIDTSFRPKKLQVSQQTYTVRFPIVINSTGGVLVGGPLQTFDGQQRPGIALTHSNGELEAQFNPVPTRWFGNFPNTVFAVQGQPDGKLIVAGNFLGFGSDSVSKMVRLNADGTQDSTFKIPGSGIFGEARSLKLQADGKIIAAGSLKGVNGRRLYGGVARFLADGLLDTTFQISPVNGYNYDDIDDILPLPSGKFLIAGGGIYTVSGYVSVVSRLNPDGSTDSTWVHWPGERYIHRLYLDSAARVYELHLGAGHNESTNAITRIAADGEYDVAFHNNVAQVDYLFGDSSSYFGIKALALLPGGKMYFGGVRNTGPCVFGRLNEDGTLDANYPTGGFTSESDGSPNISELLLQPDGNLIVAGTFNAYRGQPVAGVCRLLPDGTLDTTFSAGAGLKFPTPISIPFAYPNERLPRIAAFNDSSAYVFGEFSEYDHSRLPYLNRISIKPRAVITSTAVRPTALRPITVLPNPSSGRITMDAPGYSGGVEVLTTTGRTVQQLTMRNGRLTADLSALPAGLYLVRCGNRSARVVRQ